MKELNERWKSAKTAERDLKRGCPGSRSLEEVITRSSSIVEVPG